MRKKHSQSGNILFIILIAIILVGALTVAIQGTSSTAGNITRETLILRISEAQRFGGELERGIRYILHDGKSEGDIRFSHPKADDDYGDFDATTDKSTHVFAKDGGGVLYRSPPLAINDGSPWEFYGTTALPYIGSDEAELIAVLPNVTDAFCDAVNTHVGLTQRPQDTGTCLSGNDADRFSDSTQFSARPNTPDINTFSITPTLHACITCTSDQTSHYYYVLIAR